MAQRAHWAEPLLGVLGSPPWLFANLLAPQEVTSNKASIGNLKTRTRQDQGMAVKKREVSSALSMQGLSCQRATCALRVMHQSWAHEGTGTSKEVPSGFGHQRAVLPLSTVQAWRHGSQGTKRPQRPEASHEYKHLHLGSVSRQPRARICNRVWGWYSSWLPLALGTAAAEAWYSSSLLLLRHHCSRVFLTLAPWSALATVDRGASGEKDMSLVRTTDKLYSAKVKRASQCTNSAK